MSDLPVRTARIFALFLLFWVDFRVSKTPLNIRAASAFTKAARLPLRHLNFL
jgi:hypothetical protein